jgi:hypothetical protein
MKFKESRPFATSEAIAHGWITMHPSGALPVAHASRGGPVCVTARLTGAHEMARYPGDLSGRCTRHGRRPSERSEALLFGKDRSPVSSQKFGDRTATCRYVQLCTFNDGIWGIAAAKAVDLECRSLGPFSEYFFNDLQAG